MDQEYLQLARKNGKENCPSIIAFLFLREREKGGEDEVKKKVTYRSTTQIRQQGQQNYPIVFNRIISNKIVFLTKFAFIFVRF